MPPSGHDRDLAQDMGLDGGSIAARDSQEGRTDRQRRPTLLVATDGSDPALHAGERAALLAKGLGAKLFVLNVVDLNEVFHAGIHSREVARALEHKGNEATGKFAALAVAGGVEHEELVLRGPPAQVIVHTADDVGAQYVLMGAEGLSRIGRAIVGSVSQEVLRLAERPVVLLVGGGRPLDDPLLARFERD